MLAVAYSYAQKRVVTESDSVLVWYDYDKLQKCDPGEEMRRILEQRMDIGRKVKEEKEKEEHKHKSDKSDGLNFTVDSALML